MWGWKINVSHQTVQEETLFTNDCLDVMEDISLMLNNNSGWSTCSRVLKGRNLDKDKNR